MFVLLADDTIYLKADEALKAELREEGLRPVRVDADSGPRKGEKSRTGLLALAGGGARRSRGRAWGRKALAWRASARGESQGEGEREVETADRLARSRA